MQKNQKQGTITDTVQRHCPRLSKWRTWPLHSVSCESHQAVVCRANVKVTMTFIFSKVLQRPFTYFLFYIWDNRLATWTIVKCKCNVNADQVWFPRCSVGVSWMNEWMNESQMHSNILVNTRYRPLQQENNCVCLLLYDGQTKCQMEMRAAVRLWVYDCSYCNSKRVACTGGSS